MPLTRPFKDSSFLKQARERFKLGDEADGPQAERERSDIAFESGEQWPADIRLARQAQQPTAGMPAVPARPTLTINKVREPVRQILNQERESDIGVEIVPADDFGDLGITPDDTEITLREGLVRRIQRESQAADARSWAFKRAVIAGRGYYLVMTRFLPGKTWDQEIYVHRIYNQSGVILDPSHEQPDGSDADWGFIGAWVPWDRVSHAYPVLADGARMPLSEFSDADFTAAQEDYPDWYRDSYSGVDKHGKETRYAQRAVRVVDYWYTERTPRTIALLEDGTALYEDELPEGVTPVDTRIEVTTAIKFCKILGGTLIVEQTDWAGPDMPIVKVLGEEILPYDHQRRAEGMVRQARGSNEGVNYMVSKFVESVGLSQIPRDRIDPDAIDGYEPWWAAANTRTLPYLPYRSFDDNGRPFNQPMQAHVDPNILPIAQGIALFNEFVKDTTAVSDPALGQADPSVKSARHARYLIDESRMSTSNFMDNLARSIRYEGQVINNLLYPIYGATPGRLVRTLTGEGEAETMRVGDPAPQAGMQAPPPGPSPAVAAAKLTQDAHFNVIVKVAKKTENRREQFIRMFSEILNADPTQMAVAGDLFYKNMDIPEAKQLADRQRAMLAPPIQQYLASQEQGKDLDPAAHAEIAQLQQRVQELEAIAAEMDQAIKADTIKVQAETHKALEVEKLKAERDLALEDRRLAVELEKVKQDNATRMYIADLQAKTKGVLQATEMEHEAMALDHAQQHESEQAELDRENLARQSAHEAAMTDGAADRAEAEAERGRQAAQG